MIALTIVIISACVLILTCIALFIGYRKASVAVPQVPVESTQLTVIIAAHNEEQNLPQLLEALQEQSYPHELISVIIADDRSSDHTSELLRGYSPGEISFKTIRIDNVPEGVSPKKYALAKAIESATTEFLLFTDADCIPGNDWVSGLVSVLQTDDVVLGASPLATQELSFVERYACYESHRTQLFMHGAAGLGMPYMSTGRNWAYRKSVYKQSGGLEELYHILGGDDDLLLQRFTRNNARIGSCLLPESDVRSFAPASLKELFRQKTRHYSVSKHYTLVPATILAFIQVTEITLLISGIFSLSFLSSGLNAASYLSIAILVLLWISLHLVLPRQSFVQAMLAPFWELIHLLVSTITGIRGLFKTPNW
jgi:cellulose synthase/poly-beta-1,6-N-acetylglucosamine synthase-like glycosyltransferase